MSKRIAILLYSTGYGGLEIKTIQRAAHLQSIGVNVKLFYKDCEGSDNIKAHCNKLGVESQVLFFQGFIESWENRFINKFRCAFQFIKILKFKPTKVYIPFNWSCHGFSFLWLCNKFSIPNVISVHGYFPAINNDTNWLKKHSKNIFQYTTDIFSLTSSSGKNFCNIHKLDASLIEKVNIIPNWISQSDFTYDPDFRSTFRSRYNIKENDLLFGHVGRLEKIKRSHISIHLLKEFKDKYPLLNPKLIFIGDGSEESTLKALVNELSLTEHVIFAGFHTNIAKCYSAIDFNLLTSESEGFGSTIVEGMAAGCISVVSDKPGLNDLVDDNHNGIVMKEGANNYSHKIYSVYQSPFETFRIRVNAMKGLALFDKKAILDKFSTLF